MSAWLYLVLLPVLMAWLGRPDDDQDAR